MKVYNIIYAIFLLYNISIIPSYAYSKTTIPYNIVIKGNSSTSEKFIKSYFNKKSLNGNISEINKVVKKLYNSSLFEDIRVYNQDRNIIVTLKERKKITAIRFTKNNKMKEE